MDNKTLLNDMDICIAGDCYLRRCSFFSKGKDCEECMTELIIESRNKFKELIEENKRLTEEKESFKQAMEHEHASFMETFGEYGEKCDKLTEENERLREDNEIKSQKRANIFEIVNAFERGRADGVRKMQERLDKHFCHDPAFLGVEQRLIMGVVDQIAKEMLEEGVT